MSLATLCLPQRPFKLVDAVNRMALATGSTRTAQQAAHADYNGHRIVVSYSSFRNAWSAFFRASGLCVCTDCDRLYYDHPQDPEHSWLNVLCDGQRVKL